jgi:outer membrane protein TolC
VITVTGRAASKLLELAGRRLRLRATGGLRRGWIGLGVLLCTVAWFPSAWAAQPGAASPQSYGYFDFGTCVRYALVHSEPFLKSRIDIQIKSADLKDAHSQILPTLQLITNYYLIRASNNNSNNNNGNNNQKVSPLSVQLTVSEWDPYLALIQIKSRKILVDIAKTTHMNKISDGVAEMAKLFYRVHVLDRLIHVRRQMSAIRREKVDYGGSRLKLGNADPLEVKVWETTLRGDEIKLRELEQEKEERLAELKRLMGYHPDFPLPVDTRDAVNQILGGFNGQFVAFPDVQVFNKDLKILAKQEQLQSNWVTGAYVAIVPKPMIVVEGLSNEPDRTSGFNLALGLNYAIWDGLRRVRDIKRQKMKAEQATIDRDDKSRQLYNKFQRLTGDLRILQAKESFTREKARLAELCEEKAFLLYKQGNTPGEPPGRAPGRLPGDSQARDQNLPRDLYGNYLDKRVEKVEAELESVMTVQDRVNALIDLATMAGGLERYNARIRY